MHPRKNATAILLTAALLAAGALFSHIPSVHADTASDLAVKIQTQNKAISDLEAEIASYQSQLAALGKSKNTLANAIATLNLESQKLNADIKVTEGRIAAENLTLESLGTSIRITGDNIEDLKSALAKGLREMNSEDRTSVQFLLLTQKDLGDLWHYVEERSAFHASLEEKAGELATTKVALVNHQTDVQKAKDELVTLRARLGDQKAINLKTQAQKSSLLKSTKNQEAGYQQLVASKQKLKSQMESDLHAYESQLKYVLDPRSIPAAGSSPFIWPVDRVVITQLFGKTVAAARLYTTGSHNGVDFGTPTGTPVKAMANGTVAGTGNADLACPGASYGNWVFIKYDNGLASVYGHLSLIKTAKGARVSTGEVVAYSGATGYATGPHLHVSVFPNNGVSVNSFPSQACPGRTITIPTAAANAYLDPMLYFPKR